MNEHGETTHGMLLFESTLNVPLILAVPGVAAALRNDPVSLVDIAPTLMAVTGQQKDARDIYAETDYPVVAGWHAARALIQNRYQLIASGNSRLFDLSADVAEVQNLAPMRSQTVVAMAARLDAFNATSSSATPAPSARR